METVHELLGIGVKPEDLGLLQLSLRSLIVFVCALVMLRFSAKRFLGRKTAFDILLTFVLGSMLSRAINGSAAFFGSIGAALVLVLFHRLFAALAFYSHAFGWLIKGSDDLVIQEGQVREAALRKNYLTRNDLLEDLRLKSVGNPSQVREARLERSGDLSVLKSE